MKIFKSLNSERVKQHKFIFRFLLLYSILNFGSYSFLRYSFNGLPISNIVLEWLKYFRIIVVWFPVVYYIRSNVWNIIWKKNKDILLIFVSVLISSLFSPDFLATFSYTIWFIGSVMSFLLYLTIIEISYKEPIKVFLKDLFSISLIVIFFVIPSLPNLLNKGPEFLFFSSKNFYVYYVLILLVLYLINYSHIKILNNDKRIIHLVLFLLLFLVVFISGKRSVFIALIIELFIFMLFTHSRWHKYKRLQKLIMTLILFFGFYLIFSNWSYYSSNYATLSRFVRLINNTNLSKDKITDSSYEERLYLWNKYENIYKESPIFGNGFLGAQIILGKGEKEDMLSTHNTYLSILTDTGLFGAIIMSIILFRRVLYVFKLKKYNYKIIFFMLVIPVLMINYSESNLYPGQIFFIYSFLVVLMPFHCLTNYKKH